ncbi:unnamed protein product [Lupinus luteus]|uniref:Non-specific lipid-transfer protein n=1 Tax=Lupinus luteus TaxID=3873 RepID=A0AAV1XXI7_LUPLU
MSQCGCSHCYTQTLTSSFSLSRFIFFFFTTNLIPSSNETLNFPFCFSYSSSTQFPSHFVSSSVTFFSISLQIPTLMADGNGNIINNLPDDLFYSKSSYSHSNMKEQWLFRMLYFLRKLKSVNKSNSEVLAMNEGYDDDLADIECAEIIEYLQTCVPYLKHGGASDIPPSTCCDGVKAVVNKLKSVDDKRDACNCIKAIVQITKLKLESARNIPIKCGIKIPFQISPDFDCSL